jgi:hypothetical protein
MMTWWFLVDISMQALLLSVQGRIRHADHFEREIWMVPEGDLLRITTADTREGFLFNVSRDEVQSRGQLQVCVMLRCVSGA